MMQLIYLNEMSKQNRRAAIRAARLWRLSSLAATAGAAPSYRTNACGLLAHLVAKAAVALHLTPPGSSACAQ